MKTTVIELRAMLDGLPDNLPIQFEPITGAYMGASHPLVAKDISFFSGLKLALPSDAGAHGVIYIHEDERQEL